MQHLGARGGNSGVVDFEKLPCRKARVSGHLLREGFRPCLLIGASKIR